MVRRSFRFGLRLGLLTGVAVAVVKMLQARRESGPSFSAQPAPWPPAPSPATAGRPPEPEPAPEPTPAPPVPEPEPAVADAAVAVAPGPASTEPVAAAPETPAPATAARKRKAPAVKETPDAADRAWVEPTGGVCPTSHPVKAKMSSRLFHLPGMFAYDRTRPDRCYPDEATAVADGLTKAKR